MYLIDKEKNRLERLDEKTFSELGLRERENLQEWIANNPSVFGEDLLIIQKEFSGFSDTNERLDLLALDKNGDLVVIENKLDDTGRDVTWQALKYTSYCSSLSKENIRKIFQEYLNIYQPNSNAEELITDFFEADDYAEINLNKGLTQRIIMVAARFRKEVTSTVLWLLNYKLRIQCFRATPYGMNDQLFLNLEQIIPTKDAEEFMIGMADKVQDDIDNQTQLKNRHYLRKEFWTGVIKAMNEKSDLYQNISPSIYNWIGAGSGVRGVGFNFAASKNYGRAEIYIDRGEKEENEFIFDELYKEKEAIEENFGSELVWERLDEKRACRIKSEIVANIFNKNEWKEMVEFMTNSMVRIEYSFKNHLVNINRKLKHGT